MALKNVIFAGIGAVGSFLAYLFGGWDSALITLIIFMAVDFATGLIVAGVFHKSPKTEKGALESRAGFKGLCRKFLILAFVIMANRLDIVLGVDYVRTFVCISFMCNELLSIVENAGLMGVPIPAVITKSIEILKSKTGDSNDETENLP